MNQLIEEVKQNMFPYRKIKLHNFEDWIFDIL